MSTETIAFLNFLVHSLIIGATAWLLVRFVIRDAMRRCILANLAVLMCLYSPFDISMRDLFPTTQHVPVFTPIRETLEHDWRVKVEPQKVIATPTASPLVAPSWDWNDLVKCLHRSSWLVTALLLLRLLVQSIRLQRWAWRLRALSADEAAFLRESVLECAGPPALSNVSRPSKSSRGLEHSKTLSRMRVSDVPCTPCAAGWFFPIIAVPAQAFGELTAPQWRWLIRHETEHLRTNDTVAVLLQNIVLAFLWWNPFAHALVEEYARAREEACDAAAVGEEPDHAPYADFLLAWAGRPSPSRFAMTIAHSRPARRLRDRLVALAEARGVRKKVGALFVLGCLAFVMIAPLVVASFGITTASAREQAKAPPKDETMLTRLYKVGPDLVPAGSTAKAVLEKQGISFPEGASALFQPATSSLIVRHHQAALDQIEAIIDRLHHRLPQVYFQCKLIQADQHVGRHESILQSDEAEKLWQENAQKKGIDLLTAPGVTTLMGQGATVEVVREILPKKPWAKDIVIQAKFIGPSLKLVANPAPDGKATIEAKVDLGIDPDAERPWLPKKDAPPDWTRVQTLSVSSKAVLAAGETLVLHLPGAKKPVTALITVEALNPSGLKAISFESTATKKPSSTGIDVPDKVANEWAVRVYKLPKNFPQDKPPLEMLKAAGIPFPKGADAALQDGKLTVWNTKANLELIDVWLDAMSRAEVKKRVHLTVLVAELKGDFLKQINDWLPPLPEKVEVVQAPANTPPLPPAVLREFTVSGIFTNAQMQIVMKRLAETGAKLEILRPNQKTGAYALPASMNERELKIEPVIGPDGYSIEMTVRTPPQDENPASGISTAATIWDGQTLVLGAQPSEGVSRLLFITGSLIQEKDKK
ncbi:MAG: M56 family metallopeptidase [Verrucomicrobiaceae bacterium]|nr:M56 family metallopeptidase [Verrucomicrobiaceae bacterium]